MGEEIPRQESAAYLGKAENVPCTNLFGPALLLSDQTLDEFGSFLLVGLHPLVPENCVRLASWSAGFLAWAIFSPGALTGDGLIGSISHALSHFKPYFID